MKRLASLLLALSLLATVVLPAIGPVTPAFAQTDGSVVSSTDDESAVDPTETPIPTDTPSPTDTPVPLPTDTALPPTEPMPSPTVEPSATEEQVLPASTEETIVPISTPFKNLHIADLVAASRKVNCREEPAITGTIVTILARNQQAIVLSEPTRVGEFDWVQLMPLGAQTGCFAAAQYLDLIQADYGLPTAVVTAPVESPVPTETLTPSQTSTPSETATATSTLTGSETATSTATSTATTSSPATLTPTYKNLHAGDLAGASQKVNCRTSNSTSSGIRQILQTNDRGVLLSDPARANDYDWVFLRPTGASTGCYVAAQYLTLIQSGYELTPAASATASGTAATSGPYKVGDIVVTTASVNLRTDAGTNNPIVRTISANAQGTVMSGYKKVGADDWIQVQFPSGNGWLTARYTTLVTSNTPGGPFAAGETIVAVSAVNLRTAPGVSNPSLGLLQPGYQGSAKGAQARIDGMTWVQVEFPLGAGWVAAQYLKKITAVTRTPAPSTANVLVYLDCTSNPERIIVQNTNPGSIQIISIGSTYQPGAGEPFAAGDTIGANVTYSYESNSSASGSFKLTSREIFDNNAGSQEGVVVKTSAGDVTASCASVVTGEKWIEVNLSSQTMTVWRGSTKISSSLVSTGKPGFETPTGTFYISVKYESVTMSGCAGGECWTVPAVPWDMLFLEGGFFIHGAYWHNDFGRLRLSHGCVNLPVPYAEWLYSWTPMGTRVWIHY